MKIELSTEPVDVFAELARWHTGIMRDRQNAGALASFVGSMRDFNDGEPVTRMVLEHYPLMTERQLTGIVETAIERWPLIDSLVLHRVGEIFPGDPIVLVAVWSEHRGAAFDACRHIMEELKAHAPFWKKEVLPDRERWVDRNTSGY